MYALIQSSQVMSTFCACVVAHSLNPDAPPKRKGGSGEYSTASHHGLAVAVDSAKS